MEFPFPVQDRQLEYFDIFDERMRRRLLSTISPEIIEEHRAKPLGQHSDTLDRLLNYFRRGGLANKLGILRVDGDAEQYRLIRFAGQRGTYAHIPDGGPIASLNEAYHAVFLQRIEDLKASLNGDDA